MDHQSYFHFHPFLIVKNYARSEQYTIRIFKNLNIKSKCEKKWELNFSLFLIDKIMEKEINTIKPHFITMGKTFSLLFYKCQL